MVGNTVALTMIPAFLFGLIYFAVVIFCVWKFYQILSRMNDNFGRIKQAIDGTRVKAPEE